MQNGEVKEEMGLEISWYKGKTDHNYYDISVW